MKRIALLAGLAAAFFTGGMFTVLAVANAALHAPQGRRALHKAAGSAPGHSVSIGGTLLLPPFGCYLRNLSIRTSPHPHGSELLEIPWARIRPAWTSLARGQFVVREMVLERPRVTALLEEDRLRLPLFGSLSLSDEGLSSPLPGPESSPPLPQPPGPVLPEAQPPPSQSASAQNGVPVAQPAEPAPALPRKPAKITRLPLRIRDARFSLRGTDAGLPPLCVIDGIQFGVPTKVKGADPSHAGDDLTIRRIDLLGRTVVRNVASPIEQNAQNRLLLSGLRGQALGGELSGQFLVGLLDPGLPFLGTLSVKGASLAGAVDLPSQWGIEDTEFEGVLEIKGLARRPASLSGQALARIIEEPPPGLPGGTLIRGHLHSRLSAGTVSVDDAYFASPRVEFRAAGFADLSGHLHFAVRSFFGEGGQSALEEARRQLSNQPSPPRWGRLDGRDDAYLDCIVSGTPQDLRTDLLGPSMPVDQALTLLFRAPDAPGGFPGQDLQSGVSPPESR
ncbi:MAG TPA: hypothetical protein VMN36_01345 [Verrucomicrobiales bacterium]|nr:hypothetical protein [Verrucomicrobiales bacterium]